MVAFSNALAVGANGFWISCASGGLGLEKPRESLFCCVRLEVLDKCHLFPEADQPLHFFAIFEDNRGRNAGDPEPPCRFRATFDIAFPDFYIRRHLGGGLFDDFRLSLAVEVARLFEADHAQSLACFGQEVGIDKLDFLHAHNVLLSST